MKVLYIANHGKNDNDDEGAVSYALEENGCDVVKMTEREATRHLEDGVSLPPSDFVLYHHWHDIAGITKIDRPKFFWCFDLIDWPDPTLEARCARRKEWITCLTTVSTHGFMTDGDWVSRCEKKLTWLTQGFDSRLQSTRHPTISTLPPILFTGIGTGGGVEREDFVAWMTRKYGSEFHHVQKGVHRERMRDLVGGSKIVVAPDSPVTDRYWSNRVYNACGFGAFLLHPWSKGLREQYNTGDLLMYASREELSSFIEYYLKYPELRAHQAQKSRERTLKAHTYVKRVEKMLSIVKEKL